MTVRTLLIAVAVAVAGIPAASATPRNHQAIAKRCGSFKYGTDGRQPGPGGITATNVSCWFARATALLGPAPGWRCKNTVGLRFVCRRGTAMVAFYGE
jgi:hypothetical protein